jgi:MFS family permease
MIIIACIVAIIGSALSVVKDIYVMMAGQFIFGLGGGASMFLCSTLLEEVVPAHVFDWGYG